MNEFYKVLAVVHDRVTGVYSDPYVFINEDDMRRRIKHAFASNPFYKDMDLYIVGMYCDSVGRIEPKVDKHFISTVAAIVDEVTDHE